MTMLLTVNSCQRCKHGRAIQGQTELECRLNPPLLFAAPAPNGIQVICLPPKVHPDYDCSHFQRRFDASAAPG